MKDSLLQYVLDNLDRTRGQWAAVAAGSGVSKRTIEKIAVGKIVDPGVRKVEKLACYFRGHEQARSRAHETRIR